MRQFLAIMLAVFCAAVFTAASLTLRADDDKKEQAEGEANSDEVIDVRYHLKALAVFLKELEKAEEADRRTNPRYAAQVGQRETLQRLLDATKQDFDMGRATTNDYRHASEQLARLDLETIVPHTERVNSAKAHVERMTDLANKVKARREVGAIGEREMLEARAAQESAEQQLRIVQGSETHSSAEVMIRQRAADPLERHYRKVSALFAANAKGGEAETHAAAGREHYLAQAEIAMAQGKPKESLSALQAAALFADRALIATQAAYEVGTVRSSDAISAAKARGEVFRKYWETYRVFGDPKKLIELPADPFFAGLGVKQAAR
jgi:hypothetical protein